MRGSLLASRQPQCPICSRCRQRPLPRPGSPSWPWPCGRCCRPGEGPHCPEAWPLQAAPCPAVACDHPTFLASLSRPRGHTHSRGPGSHGRACHFVLHGEVCYGHGDVALTGAFRVRRPRSTSWGGPSTGHRRRPLAAGGSPSASLPGLPGKCLVGVCAEQSRAGTQCRSQGRGPGFLNSPAPPSLSPGQLPGEPGLTWLLGLVSHGVSAELTARGGNGHVQAPRVSAVWGCRAPAQEVPLAAQGPPTHSHLQPHPC